MQEMLLLYLMWFGRIPVLESPSDQGRETKWSVGPGGGLEVWGGGLWSAAEGRLLAPWSSGRDRRCGWADGLRGLGRNGPLLWVPGR